MGFGLDEYHNKQRTWLTVNRKMTVESGNTEFSNPSQWDLPWPGWSGWSTVTTMGADFLLFGFVLTPYFRVQFKVKTGSTLLQSSSRWGCRSCLPVIGHQCEHSQLHNVTSHNETLACETPAAHCCRVFDSKQLCFGVNKRLEHKIPAPMMPCPTSELVLSNKAYAA